METLKNRTFKMLTNDAENWDITKYYATHKLTKLRYWIANGIVAFHVDSHEVDVSLGVFNWIALFFWIKDAQRIKLLRAAGEKV